MKRTKNLLQKKQLMFFLTMKKNLNSFLLSMT